MPNKMFNTKFMRRAFIFLFTLAFLLQTTPVAQAANDAASRRAAQIANLKQQASTARALGVTKQAEARRNEPEAIRLQASIDAKQKQIAELEPQLTAIQNEENAALQVKAQDVTKKQTTKTDNIGGPIGVAKDSLNNVANGIDNVVTALKQTGASDADIKKVFREAGVDPKGLASELRGLANQVQAMNLSELRRWRDQLETERVKAQNSKNAIEAKAAKERAELAKIDREIAAKKSDKRYWETRRDDHNREADRLWRECNWCPWNLARIGWEKSAAATDQGLAWATDGDINIKNFFRTFPALVVSANSLSAAPYALSIQTLASQRDGVNQTIGGIEADIKRTEAERQAIIDQNNTKRRVIKEQQDGLRRDIAVLEQRKADLRKPGSEADILNARANEYDRRAAALQTALNTQSSAPAPAPVQPRTGRGSGKQPTAAGNEVFKETAETNAAMPAVEANPTIESEPALPTSQKECDPNLPKYQQKDCVEKPVSTEPSPFEGKPCNDAVPRYQQVGCVQAHTAEAAPVAFEIGSALQRVLGEKIVAATRKSVAGTYRCYSMNVGGRGGKCTSPALVLKTDGTYTMSSEKGKYTIKGDVLTLSKSKIRGPGTLSSDGLQIYFTYTYNGLKQTVTYLKLAK